MIAVWQRSDRKNLKRFASLFSVCSCLFFVYFHIFYTWIGLHVHSSIYIPIHYWAIVTSWMSYCVTLRTMKTPQSRHHIWITYFFSPFGAHKDLTHFYTVHTVLLCINFLILLVLLQVCEAVVHFDHSVITSTDQSSSPDPESAPKEAVCLY